MSNDDLKMNPLDPKVMERVVEELTDERERQVLIKKEAHDRKRSADPQLLLVRIENLENQLISVREILGKHSEMIGRLITLAETNAKRLT